jgi:hypothetical protein
MFTSDPRVDSVSPPGEDAAIQAIAEMAMASVRREYPPGSLAQRDAHPKHHGIVRAEFRVGADLPNDLRHGLFARPEVYRAWIRFSNGSPTVQSDTRPDQRGMAIKLLDVPGEKMLDAERNATTQDFVLASFPRFFIRNVADYVAFTRAATKKPSVRVFSFFFGGMPWRWHLHELRTLLASLQRAGNVLALRYWSQTAYRLGPHAVKYSARPITSSPSWSGPKTKNFLGDVMRAQLADAPAMFEFLVQRQSDPVSMPIEDATIEWDERRAPFQRVATITIPAQRFDSDRQMSLAENASFTPWHSLPEHAPLGAVNRTRRAVYNAVSRLRHELNHAPRAEPTSLEWENSDT